MGQPFGSNFDFGISPFFKDEGWEEWPPNTYIQPEREGDIRLFPLINASDLRIGDRDLIQDPGLETSVIISLFTDKRAGDEDFVPDRNIDRRGWFGDALNEDGDADGSHLWLLSRSKGTKNIPSLAKEYMHDALRWMVQDGIAEKIVVNTVTINPEMLLLVVTIVKPDAKQGILFRYQYNWEKQFYKEVS